MWPVSINCNVLFLCCVYMLCAHSLKPTGLFSACSESQNILLLFFFLFQSRVMAPSAFLNTFRQCVFKNKVHVHFQAIFPSSSCGSCLILPSLLPTSMNSLEVPDIHTLWNTVITMIKSEHKKLCHWGCGRKAGNYRSINFKKMRFRGRRRRNREELFVVKSLSCKVTQTWLEYEQANPPALTHIWINRIC